jgi:hypothetical protein
VEDGGTYARAWHTNLFSKSLPVLCAWGVLEDAMDELLLTGLLHCCGRVEVTRGGQAWASHDVLYNFVSGRVLFALKHQLQSCGYASGLHDCDAVHSPHDVAIFSITRNSCSTSLANAALSLLQMKSDHSRPA